MTILDTLPIELVHKILELAQPVDVASFAQSNRTFRSLVYGSPNQQLWKELFLAEPLWDDPRECVTPCGEFLAQSNSEYEFDWKGEVKRRTRARTLVNGKDLLLGAERAKPGELRDTLQTLISMIVNVPPSPPSFNRNWVKEVLGQGIFLDTCSVTDPVLSDRLAQLHTYFGLTLQDADRKRQAESRGFIYDLRNYTSASNWGPYLPDGTGRVNWAHVRAVHQDMAMHSIMFDNYGDTHLRLWYNNSALLPNGSRDISPFRSKDFVEVPRDIECKFTVTHIVPDAHHPLRPKIHFKGSVQGMEVIVGHVELTKHHDVRWHFRSSAATEFLWSSEGIQIGAVRSEYGVLGTWTTVSHDDDDPVGPFWLRKKHILREELPKLPDVHLQW
ncbi:hypothetical protein BD410DRAFT_882839 [Rickenella mellea]|uniref:F-box domain-containing protein n=1 Tax=Rickenella mellea TaxID=50990 RepID=A0A4Y7PRK9_9AGAM|nr:hypothetical protein BD410DRAFT_882839 [Rickenella mellea]